MAALALARVDDTGAEGALQVTVIAGLNLEADGEGGNPLALARRLESLSVIAIGGRIAGLPPCGIDLVFGYIIPELLWELALSMWISHQGIVAKLIALPIALSDVRSD